MSLGVGLEQELGDEFGCFLLMTLMNLGVRLLSVCCVWRWFVTVCCFLHICLSSFLRPSSFSLLVTYFLFRAAPRGERVAVHGGKRGPATAVWERGAMRGGKHGL